MALIEIRNLVKMYGTQKVLNGINLDVEEGEIKVVMGASGCGKSTLLRCINRLEEFSSGLILFDGANVSSPETNIRLLRQKIGFVFQQYALYRHLNVLDNVVLGLTLLIGMDKPRAQSKAMEHLERLGMNEHALKYPSELSGGQKQRVALARALAMNPKVIILDEPTSALDPVMSHEVGNLIRSLNSDGVTILCVSHDVHLAKTLADRVTFLEHGKVKAEDFIARLACSTDDYELQAFFGN